MPLVDLIHHLIDVAPVVMLLCVAVVAGVLWRRTRRASSLAQFIASVLLFAGFALYHFRRWYVTPYDHSAYADAMRSEPMRISTDIAQFIGMVVFAIGYLWYALTHKRI